MNKGSVHLRAGLVRAMLALSILILLTIPARAQSASSSAFGESVDVDIDALVVSVDADSGPLPQASGATPGAYNDSDSLASVDVNAQLTIGIALSNLDVLSTGLLEVSASGDEAGGSAADSSVADVDLALLGSTLVQLLLGLSADAVTSEAQVDGSCTASGSASLVNASVAGAAAGLAGIIGAVAANPAPNTVLLQVNINGGTIRVVLNEQIVSGNGIDNASITVNAIHVEVSDVDLLSTDLIPLTLASVDADIIIGQSQASADCTSSVADTDLALSISDSPDPVDQFGTLMLDFLVDNLGNDADSDVQLSVTLPGNTSYGTPSASQGSCQLAGPALDCDLGAIAAGGDAQVSIDVVPNIAGILTTSGSVSGAGQDSNLANNTDSEDTTVLQAPPPDPDEADLGVVLADSPDPVTMGTPLELTASVSNDGPDPATGVELVMNLPASFQFLQASADQGSCSHSTGTVTCNIGALADSAGSNVLVEVIPTQAGNFVTGASVSGDQDDPLPANNSDSESTQVDSASGQDMADLRVRMSDSPDPVETGELLCLEYEVTNLGPNDATGVSLDTTLFGGIVVDSINTPQGSCNQMFSQVSCDLGALASGASLVVDICVIPSSPGMFLIPGSVSGDQPDPTPGNNNDAEISTVEDAADDDDDPVVVSGPGNLGRVHALPANDPMYLLLLIALTALIGAKAVRR